MINKKVKVVLLPANNSESNILLGPDHKSLLIQPFPIKHSHALHLYFISEEDEIEPGDWVYNKFLKKIRKSNNYEKKDVNKIIASTQSLNIKGHYIIPKPSFDFIKTYCNKNGKIEEVLVEYEECCIVCGNSTTAHNYRHQMKVGNKLKVYDNNEIKITLKKRLYTQEEVEFLLLQCAEYWGVSSKQDYEEHNKWIENNINNSTIIK